MARLLSLNVGLPREVSDQKKRDYEQGVRTSGETENLICSGRAITAQTILCKIGTEVSRFRNASAFASWLGLCPENKITGSNVLCTKSRRVRSRVATALRMAANSLQRPARHAQRAPGFSPGVASPRSRQGYVKRSLH